MSLIWPYKDPDEVLDYEIDWADRLDGDTIDTATFSLESGSDAGLTLDNESNTTTTATVWLSGGTVCLEGLINCRVVTAAGRTMDQSVRLKIKAK